jgi:hypothetical protein
MISNHVGFRARAAVREVAKVYGLPEQEIKAVTERMGYYWSIRNLEHSLTHHPVYKDMELKDPWPEIIRQYRGSGLQPYFERASRGGLKIAYKPQNVSSVPETYKGSVQELLKTTDERGILGQLKTQLELEGGGQFVVKADEGALAGHVLLADDDLLFLAEAMGPKFADLIQEVPGSRPGPDGQGQCCPVWQDRVKKPSAPAPRPKASAACRRSGSRDAQ